MHPTLSISSSEAQRYLLRALSLAAAIALLCACLSAYGIFNYAITWNDTQLLRYQADKLNSARDAKVLLVGDSSLGNAVDARQWSTQLGQPILSLPLTGLYGFGASYNMIRRALRTQPIETVVLFQYTGIMNQRVRPEGALLTAEKWSDLDIVPFTTTLSWLMNFSVAFNVAGTLISGRQDRTETFRPLDYAPQLPALPETGRAPPARAPNTAEIEPGHMFFLQKIGDLCRNRALRCFYIHGPLAEPACNRLGHYIPSVNATLENVGFQVVQGTPLCMPWSETGDSINHVRPTFKAQYSFRYLQLIRGLLNSDDKFSGASPAIDESSLLLKTR